MSRGQALKQSYIEGAFFALMVGSTEAFALVYGTKIGLSNFAFGILATFPILLGAMVTWLLPALTSFTQLKRNLVWSVLLQLIGILCMAGSTFLDSKFICLFSGLSLYWMGGMASGPLWMDWMSGWLPMSKFNRFLYRRNSFVLLVTVSVYILSGIFLQTNLSNASFLFLFLFGFLCRSVSLYYLIRSPLPQRAAQPDVAIEASFSNKLFQLPFWLGVTFLVISLFRFSSALASPYFTPYMLNELDLPVMDYVWLTSLPFFSRAFLLLQWSHRLSFLSPIAAVNICAVGIAALPLFWIFFESLLSLGTLQLMSGVLWGGFEIFTVILVTSVFPQQGSRLALGLLTASSQTMAMIGASIGGLWVDRGGSYHEIFLLSGAFRFAVVFVLIGIGWKFVNLRPSLKDYQVFLASTLSIRPSLANIGRLFVSRRRN